MLESSQTAFKLLSNYSHHEPDEAPQASVKSGIGVCLKGGQAHKTKEVCHFQQHELNSPDIPVLPAAVHKMLSGRHITSNDTHSDMTKSGCGMRVLGCDILGGASSKVCVTLEDMVQ